MTVGYRLRVRLLGLYQICPTQCVKRLVLGLAPAFVWADVENSAIRELEKSAPRPARHGFYFGTTEMAALAGV